MVIDYRVMTIRAVGAVFPATVLRRITPRIELWCGAGGRRGRADLGSPGLGGFGFEVGCDGGVGRAEEFGDHVVGIALTLGRGSDDRGEHLLCLGALLGAVAAADLAGDDGGADDLLGAPVGGVHGGVAQEGEQRRPFGAEVPGEALDGGDGSRPDELSGEAVGERGEGLVDAGRRQPAGAGFVAQAEGLLQGGLDVGDDAAARMVLAQRAGPAQQMRKTSLMVAAVNRRYGAQPSRTITPAKSPPSSLAACG